MKHEVPEWQARTALLTGPEVLERLAGMHVLVTGLGGVGAYTAEMLARAGVGEMTLIDGDVIQPSNINRQLLALNSTIGEAKTVLMEQRLKDINPQIKTHTITEYVKDDRMDEILETPFDYVVDAIDTLSPKVFFIAKTVKRGYPLVSSMGSGGKYDPTQIRIADISESYNCKFAYIVRKHLHKLGIQSGFKVAFSPEKVARERVMLVEGERNRKSVVGTISYMPAAFGIAMASVVVGVLVEGPG